MRKLKHIGAMADSDFDPAGEPEKTKSGGKPKGKDPIAAARQALNTAVRQFFATLGFFLIIIAIPIAFASPLIPIGLPIGIVGVILLGRNSIWGRNWMEGVLEKHPRVERFAPNWLMRLVFAREKRPPAGK